MSQDKKVCHECGALIPEGAVQCELCGTSIEGISQTVVEADATLKIMDAAKFCDQCGTKNRAEAKFCASCGTSLTDAFSPIIENIPPTKRLDDVVSDSAPAKTPTSALNKRTALILGVGALLVAALFGITVWSKQNFKETPAPAANPRTAAATAVADEPLSGALEAQVKPILDKIKTLSGKAKIEEQRNLITLYQTNRREDKAGEVAEEVANVESNAETWSQVGHFYYDWMMAKADMPEVSGKYALKTVKAYEKSLAITDNPDVRTDLGATYYHYSMLNLKDKDLSINPMKAIQNTNDVLSKKPDHVQANFNKGVMLSQIGRVQQAIEQFNKVKSLTKATDVAYQRAEEMLTTLKNAK